ncbi:hypothetical protein ACVDG3_22305 [Meridianimarinicoccus sp. RP-17]|uniref:hypothetical protein n=1 Tax=Meridianimarinicoccus zhengii TaxID=2056810 RepID=UPI000DAD26B1|nr:hypothetical protein [Phycocomes zhengii]
MRTVIVLLFCFLPFGAQAQRLSDRVLDAMEVAALFDMLQQEAVASGLDLGAEMMPGRDLAGWERTLARLNDPDTVLPEFRDAFAVALDAAPGGSDAQGTAILTYLTTPPGDRIVGLELSARAALNEPGIEEAVLARFEVDRAAGSDFATAVDRFIAINDLVDRNVTGALAANAAFLTGLQEGADAPGTMGTGDVLADVWEQEPAIRASTEDWLDAFVSLAYGPLDTAELQTHIAFSESPAGQAFNDAIFTAFDTVLTDLSYDTGAALARLLASEDL